MIINAICTKQIDANTLEASITSPVFSPYGRMTGEFKVVGETLPATLFVPVNMTGIWERSKNGIVFRPKAFEYAKPENPEEMFRFLRGLGFPKPIAGPLSIRQGLRLEESLDEDLEGVVGDLNARYWQKTAAKRSWIKFRYPEIFKYFRKFDVSEKTAGRVFDRYRKTAMNVTRTEPYSLMEIPGMKFSSVDAIAKDNNVGERSRERIEAGILAALREIGFGGEFMKKYNRKNPNIVSGSTCITWEDLCPLVRYILKTDSITDQQIGQVALYMEKKVGSIYIEDDRFFFMKNVAEQEANTAKNIHRLMGSNRNAVNIPLKKLQSMQQELIKEAGLAGKLSEEQQLAVKLSLESAVSIITGGPGTGKTTIQTAILYLIKKYRPEATITMIAPTGRAAARMTESSGYPAATIHSALGLYGEDEYNETEAIKSDVIVVDEFSMVDAMLADKLFASLQTGTKVICLGDINQLPSVGAGAVLREMIDSKVVPTARLTGVFRQKKGSSIADNAYKVNDGSAKLVYDESFRFVPAAGDGMQDAVVKTFREAVQEFGVDDVCVLTPYRNSTSTGVKELNKRLQQMVEHSGTASVRANGNIFCCGDKVMFMKNKKGLCNGDVGRILSIKGDTVTVDFGKKEPSVLKDADLENLELAYACTIHKSQGSEYKCVILILNNLHSNMLKKNLVYTAITRSRQRIYIVGQIEALKKSVASTDLDLRKSRLAARLTGMKKPNADDGK